MIVKSTGTVSDPCPAGNHVARCIGLIDLGTQEESYQGKPKQQRKILVKWETPLETKVFKVENGEQPYVISKEYTMSLGEKANLKKDLESWRGRAFTEQELAGFDLKTILGAPCLVNVIHNDNGYAKITSVSPLPKGTTCPTAVNKFQYFSLEEFDKAMFDSMSDLWKKKIESSPEYKSLGSPERSTSFSDMGTEIGDEDIPF